MYIRSVDRAPAERFRGARVDGDVGAADGGEDAEGVGRCLGEGGVAVDGAGAEEAEGGVVGGEEDGEGVLGVGVVLDGGVGEGGKGVPYIVAWDC